MLLIWPTARFPQLSVGAEMETLPWNNTGAVPAAVITSLDPTTGPPNRLVTITGTGFAAAMNVVKFGAVVAAVLSESVTSIVTLVPFMAAGSAPVTVNTSDPSAFTVQPSAGLVPAFRRRRR